MVDESIFPDRVVDQVVVDQLLALLDNLLPVSLGQLRRVLGYVRLECVLLFFVGALVLASVEPV